MKVIEGDDLSRSLSFSFSLRWVLNVTAHRDGERRSPSKLLPLKFTVGTKTPHHSSRTPKRTGREEEKEERASQGARKEDEGEGKERWKGS